MKKLYIIHGWVGSPQEPLFVWLAEEAKKKGFEVTVPAMPHPDTPTINDWVNCLKSLVPRPNVDTYFVGHSIGSQAILRYLADFNEIKIGAVTLIAPWLQLTGLETEEEKEIARPWIETPIDFKKIRTFTNNYTAIFSDNDPFVPLAENRALFEENLHPEIIIEHAKGHFTEADGVTNLPSALGLLSTK